MHKVKRGDALDVWELNLPHEMTLTDTNEGEIKILKTSGKRISRLASFVPTIQRAADSKKNKKVLNSGI
jgi:hypothetical protein